MALKTIKLICFLKWHRDNKNIYSLVFFKVGAKVSYNAPQSRKQKYRPGNVTTGEYVTGREMVPKGLISLDLSFSPIGFF